MLEFVGGLVVGGGVLWSIYHFHVIPKWDNALADAKAEYVALRERARKLGL